MTYVQLSFIFTTPFWGAGFILTLIPFLRYNWANTSWDQGFKIRCGQARTGWFFYCRGECSKKKARGWNGGHWRAREEAGGMLSCTWASLSGIMWEEFKEGCVCVCFSFKTVTLSLGPERHNVSVWPLRSFACFITMWLLLPLFVHMLKIQVLAEREQKIQTEVKEIRKVFYCDLCNKQYKLAIEFESHLSSYDHNHRKVFSLPSWSCLYV